MIDRMEQINWIKEQIDVISYYGEGTAEELVTYWEKNVKTPEWFDRYDRDLLIKWVAKDLAS